MVVPGKIVTRQIIFFTCQNLVTGMILKLNLVKNIYNNIHQNLLVAWVPLSTLNFRGQLWGSLSVNNFEVRLTYLVQFSLALIFFLQKLTNKQFSILSKTYFFKSAVCILQITIATNFL